MRSRRSDGCSAETSDGLLYTRARTLSYTPSSSSSAARETIYLCIFCIRRPFYFIITPLSLPPFHRDLSRPLRVVFVLPSLVKFSTSDTRTHDVGTVCVAIDSTRLYAYMTADAVYAVTIFHFYQFSAGSTSVFFSIVMTVFFS